MHGPLFCGEGDGLGAGEADGDGALYSIERHLAYDVGDQRLPVAHADKDRHLQRLQE